MKIKNVFQVSPFALSALALAIVVSGCTVQESDPFIGDFKLDTKIAYVKRPVEAMTEADPRLNAREMPAAPNDDTELALARAGNLYLHDLSDPANQEQNLTDALTVAVINTKGPGDVSSTNVSFDGTKIVFALHEGLLSDNNAEPNTWDIWLYDLAPTPGRAALRRVITSSLQAQAGNDYDPAFLPDGRIVFSSDRGRALTGGVNEPSEDEGHTESAINLFVMTEDGDGIKQISFNQSDDRFPSVLHTGEIVFSRWEHADQRDQFDLFKVNPDGSGMQLLYGAHSHDPVVGSAQVFYRPREMADGRLLVTLMPYSQFDPNAGPADPASLLTATTSGGGELVIIDYANFADINVNKPNSTTSAQSTGQVSATKNEIKITLGEVSKFGIYASPFPIWEPGGGASRVLTSWSLCRVTDGALVNPRTLPCDGNETLELLPPAYGIFIFDLSNNTKAPVILPVDGFATTDPVVLVNRKLIFDTPVGDAVPLIIVDGTGFTQDASMASNNVGAINIRSIYDSQSLARIGLNNRLATELLPCTSAVDTNCDNSTVDLGRLADPALSPVSSLPVRYVRIVSAMANIDNVENFSYGIQNAEMRSILGYAPVEPDGSVYVEVPAGLPFGIELLDNRGRKFGSGGSFRQHENWLQVAAGETIKCQGCHEGHSQATPLNTGAGGVLTMPYANTLTVDEVGGAARIAMPPMAGETMADTRVRFSCESGLMICADRKLNRDLIYQDVWTDPAMAIVGTDDSIEYGSLTDGLSTVAPTSCTSPTPWSSNCKIVINYQQHIQTLWDAPRGAIGENTCTNCHNTVGNTQVPAGAGQLDLSSDGPRDTVNNDNQNRITSYEHLVRSARLEKELVGGVLVTRQALVDVQVQVPVDANMDGIQDVDINGVPIFTTVTQQQLQDQTLNLGAVVSPFFARRSYIIEILTGTELQAGRVLPTPTVDHTTLMTSAEIRLITEWIETGAQYFNDPGLAPRN